jgi:ankyrin repeat protein
MVNANNTSGYTALIHATENENCLVHLLSHGADVNALSSNGETALTVAMAPNVVFL